MHAHKGTALLRETIRTCTYVEHSLYTVVNSRKPNVHYVTDSHLPGRRHRPYANPNSACLHLILPPFAHQQPVSVDWPTLTRAVSFRHEFNLERCKHHNPKLAPLLIILITLLILSADFPAQISPHCGKLMPFDHEFVLERPKTFDKRLVGLDREIFGHVLNLLDPWVCCFERDKIWREFRICPDLELQS